MGPPMGFQMTPMRPATFASQVACQCHATTNLAGEARLFAGAALGGYFA